MKQAVAAQAKQIVTGAVQTVEHREHQARQAGQPPSDQRLPAVDEYRPTRRRTYWQCVTRHDTEHAKIAHRIYAWIT